jgi:HlyD family secretion protein
MKEHLYRKAALESLSVAERLDTAVQVVGPASALVTAAAGVTVVTSLVWALVGRVPTRVYGDGLILREGAMQDVTSMADGQVQHMSVNVGDVVHENDVIATIDQPELKKQVALLEAKLGEYTGKYAQLESLDEEGSRIKESVFKQQKAAVGYAVRETQKQLAFYRVKLKSDLDLLDKGLTTPAAVADTRQRVLDLSDAIHSKESERRAIAFDVLEHSRTLEERKYDLTMEVNDTKRELEELQKKLDTQSLVRAKTAGRIVEVKVTDGDAVTRGRPIATLEAAPSGPEQLVAEIYVPSRDGNRVRAVMALKLAPSVVKPEEDGYLEGTVESVSPFPVSEQSMMRTLRNGNVVDALLKSGPVTEVRVRVSMDLTTPSGLRWSNGRGPTIKIDSGTPVQGLVPALERLFTDTSSDPDEHG